MRSLRLLIRLASVALVVTLRRWVRGRLHPAYHWRDEVLVRFLRNGLRSSLRVPVARVRAQLPVMRVPRKLGRAVMVEQGGRVAGRPVELTTPAGWADGDPVVLYLHGGGYVACSPATHRDLVARLAAASGARLVSLDYRLAPEHRFPAALDDAVAACHELQSRPAGRARSLALAGDSAGGGLALATLLRLREEGAALPAGAALLSPWVDLARTGISIQANARYCFLPPEALERYVGCYLGDADPRQPLASPLYADLGSLPPLLIQTGSAEALYSEALELARRARCAGVDVTVQVYEGMFHAFQTRASVLPVARKAIDDVGAFLRRCCEGGGTELVGAGHERIEPCTAGLSVGREEACATRRESE